MVAPNLLALVAAATATMLLGGLWYSPLLLGRHWVQAHGYTADQIAEMRTSAGRAYLLSFGCYLIMAAVLATLLAAVGASGAMAGIRWGALSWLGFAVPVSLTAYLFSNKPLSAFLIDTGYQLVYLVTMGAILAAWR